MAKIEDKKTKITLSYQEQKKSNEEHNRLAVEKYNLKYKYANRIICTGV